MFTREKYAAQIERLTGRISELEEENTNLRLLDQAIRRNNAMFEALIAHSSDGILLTGPDGTIIRMVRGVLGYSAVELSGVPIESKIHPEDRPMMADCYRQLLNRRAQTVEFEGRVQRPDGRIGWILAKLTDMLDDPNVQAIVCNYTDITPRKERELVMAEFESLAGSTRGAIFSKDLDGIILTWNTSAKRTFGYSMEEIVGRHVWTLVPPELRDEESRNRKLVAETARPLEFRTVRVSKDESRIPVLVELTPVLDRYGRTRGILHASTVV